MRKYYTRGIAILSGIIVLIGGFFILKIMLQPETYTSAKSDCVKVLNKNRAELDEFAKKLLAETPQSLAGEYPKTPYTSFKNYNCHVTNHHDAVFNIGSQGMLGGQYWSLMYTADGTYRGQAETYYEIWDDNNIIKAEHIYGNWWYLWEDYDATERSEQ